LSVHPKTGLHYIVSFRACPAYDDAMHLYERMAAKYDWLECIREKELIRRMEHIAQDERNFVVIWGVWSPRPPQEREAIFTRVWSEAYDDDQDKMIKHHRDWLSSARANIRHMDGVFGHTPWMASRMKTDTVPGFVLPMGWDPELFGRPKWHARKKHRFAHVGAIAGKRGWVVPGMRYALGDDLLHVKDTWGADLLDVYNKSVAQLYLSHSDIHYFSTFRIWQMVATSAAMIAESGRDCWPMTEEMYVGVPTITRKNGGIVARMIKGLPDKLYKSKAKALNESLASSFTIEKVLTDYLIPASVEIKERRSL